MTTLLVGAAGQVGLELALRLAGEPGLTITTRSGHSPVEGLRCIPLDLVEPDAVAECIGTLRPSVVLNAAAHTAVDRAESEPELAFRLNAGAPAAMAAACRSVGARLVHYSTDYVFDGRASEAYGHDAPTAPLGVYGRSKLAGEEAIRASGVDYLILRTAWVYSSHGHNFVRTMLRVGAEREELRIVDDQLGCPTPASFIAEATLQLTRSSAPAGTFNVVTRGCTSWFGFATSIFEEAVGRGLLARAPRLVPVATSEYPTVARRPAFSVLDTTRLADAGIHVPEWREALTSVFDHWGRAAGPTPG